jgi:TetR/AcrR family transcriptional regulator, transcriptional repressor for nem operon
MDRAGAGEDRRGRSRGRRARAIFAAVEGAQLVARNCDDLSVYEVIVAVYRGSGLIP